MTFEKIPYKIYLTEDEMPMNWYNVRADMKTKPAPLLNPATGTPIDGIVGGLTYALQYLAMCILLILSLVKSGAWARDIVSGF